jgi:hypothetical protein
MEPDWLTQVYLQHLLHYDSLTGIWTWRNPLLRSKMRPGDVAGSIDSNGRRKLRIHSGYYYSARLAWLYMTGQWPKDQIDHKNRIVSDDRWENLREATQSQNSFNRGWAEAGGEWRGIRCNGNKFAVNIGGVYLGNFATFEEAKTVRDEALKKYAGPFAVNDEKEAS